MSSSLLFQGLKRNEKKKKKRTKDSAATGYYTSIEWCIKLCPIFK